ncbi:hypothetical protein HDU98_011382 [Podochytrium sp. JEL0797]|nr:hypothetical protein HDU98_011382 [Podochytrium sp. JEL0797]
MTYYSDFGIPASADEDTIRRHYVQTAYNNSFNVELFKQLAVAFLVLTTDRTKYDAFLASPSSSYTIPKRILDTDAQKVFEEAFNGSAEVVEIPVNEDGSSKSRVFEVVGAVSGAAFGFIFGGPIGAVGMAALGAYGGNVRDRTGLSTYDAFMQLPELQRREIVDRIVLGAGIAAKAISIA